MVDLHRKKLAVLDEYRALLTELIEQDGVPVAYMASQLGLQRKTVYRHIGRPMA